MLDKVASDILNEIAGIRDVPATAHSVRVDGQSYAVGSSANISVTRKADKPGIDLHIAPGTKAERVHIPVVITQPGITETVYNDFYVGAGADVEIVAGCGIHNCGGARSQHDGIHVFHLEKGARQIHRKTHWQRRRRRHTRHEPRDRDLHATRREL